MLDPTASASSSSSDSRAQHALPWNLRNLLYRGGAGAKANLVAELIATGKLGHPVNARLSLVSKFGDIITGELADGGSKRTAETRIRDLRDLYRYADQAGIDPAEDNIRPLFIDWAAHLGHRQQRQQIKPISVYQMTRRVALLIAHVLGIATKTLMRAARIRFPGTSSPVLGQQSDKQSLADTFAFGHVLLDLVESLSLDAIRGPLPLQLRFRTGQVIDEWSGAVTTARMKETEYDPLTRQVLIGSQRYRAMNTDLRARYPLVNLRMEAELLIFIAQTGMNLAQAAALKMGRFSYQSHLDGYLVRRTYKARRHGEVEFVIYSDYRVLFQCYLAWRNALFPDDPDGLLFPFVPQLGRKRRQMHVFCAVKKRCLALGIQFIGPRTLRKSRINWLLRRSNDPDLTAEMAQHTRQMLLSVYEQPSYQVTMVEATRFYQQADPSFASPGSGTCVEPVPQSMPGTPGSAPQPDCMNPAGCLFCVHQRDIDSFDHVWSLASYRYLKSLELARYRRDANTDNPAAMVVDRATAKLSAFQDSSEIRAAWVREAQARVDESHHHGKWDGFIQLAELGT